MKESLKRIKYLIIGIVIGSICFGGVVFAAQDYVLSIFNAKLIFNGTEKVGSDKPNQYFNGQTYVPTALIYNGTTYVPLRFFSESIGQPVKYDGSTKTIYVGKVPENDRIQRSMSDVMQPYFKSDSSFYVNDKIIMAGKEYIKGYKVSTWASRPFTASFNLEAKYVNITGTVGLEDGNNKYDNTFEVYGDDKLITSITLKAGELPQNLNINVSGVIKLDFKVIGSYSTVCCADMQIK